MSALETSWVLLLVVAWLVVTVFVFFVIWSRVDWSHSSRVGATVAVAMTIWIPTIPISVYAIVDVSTRKNISTKQRAWWLFGLIASLFLPVVVLAYLVWAWKHKPEPLPNPEPIMYLPAAPLPPVQPEGSRTLSSDDLDYLQKLADLLEQGVLTSEQYDEQRRQRLGE